MKFSAETQKKDIFSYFFTAGLFFLPFFFWPWGSVAYEVPRVWLMNRWIEILFLLCILHYKKDIFRKIIQSIDPLFFTVLLFFLIAVISSLFGSDLPKSISGNYFRNDGLWTYLHLIVFAFVIAMMRQQLSIRTISKAIASSSFILSLATLIMSFLLINLNYNFIPHWENRAVGATFGNPNFLAGYLVVTLPFIFQLFSENKRRVIWLIAFIIQMFAIIATNSWGGLVGIAAFFLSLLLINRIKKVWILALIILSLFGFIIFSQTKDQGFVAEGRERIFRKIIFATMERPLLGYGWANADYAFEAVEWPIKLQHDVYVDKAHSTFLEVFATTGAVGLGIYLLLIYRIGKVLVTRFKHARAAEKGIYKTLLLVFILYLFHSQTNVISMQEELMFWLVLGVAI